MLVPIIVALRDSASRLRRSGADTRRDTHADVLAGRDAAARAGDQRRHPADVRHHLQRVPGDALHRRTGHDDRGLRVYNLTRTAGFQPSTAALATTMQLVSFVVVLLFFRIFGSRYLKGRI